jgi:hypothetical protein
LKQLRICTIGDFQSWFSYYLMGTIQGSILNGHLHYSIPIRQKSDHIQQQLDYYKPHIIFGHMLFAEKLTDTLGNDLPREELHYVIVKAKKKWGSKVIMQEGDAKNDPRYPYPVNSLVDLCLVNSRRYEHFSNVYQVPCIHWPYFALNQETLSTGDNLFRHKVIFAGNVSARGKSHLHAGRSEFIGRLSKQVDIKIFPDDNVGNTRFCSADLAVSCNAVLGIQHGLHVDGYVDTRPFQYCGAGGLYFHSNCFGINQFFKPDYHYVPYDHMDADSFMAQYNRYMVDDREGANKIRAQAFEYTQKHHTDKHRIKMALDALEGKELQKIYLEDIDGKDM